MERLQVGEVISRLRKEKKLTQEQLANFMGVSTAAVSKWESSASYPDITLLPNLASFFNVTIDELLNYNTAISEDKVNKIYQECEQLFINGQFEEGVAQCFSYMKKYHPHYNLKFSLSILVNMYSSLANDEERAKGIIERTNSIFEEIIENCNDIMLVEASIIQLSIGYLVFEKHDQSLEMLKRIRMPEYNPSTLMANIYQQAGKQRDARVLLQKQLVEQITDVDATITSLAHTYEEDDLSLAERYIGLSSRIGQIFEQEGLGKNMLMSNQLSLAQIYTKHQQKEKCLSALRNMVDLIENKSTAMAIDVKNVWFLDELDDEERKGQFTLPVLDMFITVLQGKEFSFLHEEQEFLDLIQQLKNKLQ